MEDGRTTSGELARSEDGVIVLDGGAKRVRLDQVSEVTLATSTSASDAHAPRVPSRPRHAPNTSYEWIIPVVVLGVGVVVVCVAALKAGMSNVGGGGWH